MEPTKIAIRPERVARRLGAAVLILHALNVPAQMAAAAEHPGTAATVFAGLFTVNGEGRIPTWFSAALLLLCAALLAVRGLLADRAPGQGRLHWLGLAGVFVLLSMDEAAAVHDRLSVMLSYRFETSGLFASPWVIGALVLLPVLGALYARFLWRLPARTRTGFIVAGAMYVGGALGMEMVGGLVRESALYVVAASFEELLEMGGLVVFAAVLLDDLRRVAGVVPVRVTASTEVPA